MPGGSAHPWWLSRKKGGQDGLSHEAGLGQLLDLSELGHLAKYSRLLVV